MFEEKFSWRIPASVTEECFGGKTVGISGGITGAILREISVFQEESLEEHLEQILEKYADCV